MMTTTTLPVYISAAEVFRQFASASRRRRTPLLAGMAGADSKSPHGGRAGPTRRSVIPFGECSEPALTGATPALTGATTLNALLVAPVRPVADAVSV